MDRVGVYGLPFLSLTDDTSSPSPVRDRKNTTGCGADRRLVRPHFPDYTEDVSEWTLFWGRVRGRERDEWQLVEVPEEEPGPLEEDGGPAPGGTDRHEVVVHARRLGPSEGDGQKRW